MVFNKPKLIAVDIDGTIVDDEIRIISKHTADVLERLHNDGVILGLASGRSVSMIKDKVMNIWGLTFSFDFIIGLNGGELFDQSAGITETGFFLKSEYVKEIFDFMKPFKDDFTVYVYDNNTMLATRKDDIIEASAIRNHISIEIVTIDYITSQPQSKVMFRGEPDAINMASDYVSQYKGEHFQGFITQPTMLEFQSPGIDKGKTLVNYCQRHGINLKDVWSFGDTTNDNGLLQVAGLGVCMLNGTDDTKDHADIISDFDNNDDGFARFIEKYYFMEEANG